KYKDTLSETKPDQLAQARKWVDKLEATGGTAINDALGAALDFRSKDDSRSFTVVFFTDGQPTIGETNWDKIQKNVQARNSANTRIFTFGVGDDVNATQLDILAEQTRAVATYVRPAEDIEAKVSGLYAKISHPVLANLKLAASNGIAFAEVYPAQLPDLFHGQQLVALGRYSGKGPSAVTLSGTVGKDNKEFVYELTFPEKTDEGKAFVEAIWARRKVGYLLDQVRPNGEKKELVDEIVSLAKRYGITTPYTSYLIVPDGAVPVAQNPGGRNPNLPAVGFNGAAGAGVNGGFGGGGFGFGGFNGGSLGVPAAGLMPKAPGGSVQNVTDYARTGNAAPGGQSSSRNNFEGTKYAAVPGEKPGQAEAERVLSMAKDKKEAFDQAVDALRKRETHNVQAGKLGVDLSVQMNNLRNQTRLEYTAQRSVVGRNLLEVGGVWIDEGFDA